MHNVDSEPPLPPSTPPPRSNSFFTKTTSNFQREWMDGGGKIGTISTLSARIGCCHRRFRVAAANDGIPCSRARGARAPPLLFMAREASAGSSVQRPFALKISREKKRVGETFKGNCGLPVCLLHDWRAATQSFSRQVWPKTQRARVLCARP